MKDGNMNTGLPGKIFANKPSGKSTKPSKKKKRFLKKINFSFNKRKSEQPYNLGHKDKILESWVGGLDADFALSNFRNLIELRRKRTSRLARVAFGLLDRLHRKSFRSKDFAEVFSPILLNRQLFYKLFSLNVRFKDLLPKRLYSVIAYKGWFNSKKLASFMQLNLGSRNKVSILTSISPLAHVKQLTASTILTYTLRRLKKYYFPKEIFPTLLNSSRNFNYYSTIDDPKGLSFICSGRVTRRQMASCMRYQVGSTSKGTVESPLDYAQGVVPLKYGTVGVKVYLTQSF